MKMQNKAFLINCRKPSARLSGPWMVKHVFAQSVCRASKRISLDIITLTDTPPAESGGSKGSDILMSDPSLSE